jgi:ribonuclease HI
MKMPEFNAKTLNIFTDASIVQTDTGIYVSCSGAAAYTGPLENISMVDEVFQINWDSTNNNGEITAVYKGLELALKWRNQFEAVNLFSDSKLCIYTLREWIANWVQRSKGSLLIGSTNQPVANQDMIVQCVNTILNNNLQIGLYHQKGHASDRILSKSVQTFKNTNNINSFVSNEFMHVINGNNNYVDQKSREYLRANYQTAPHEKHIDIVSRIYDPNMDIDKYLTLVNN